jgi:hypothetical protein
MSLALMMSCNKCKERCDDPTNPECPNYVVPDNNDPCLGKETTHAKFEMLQALTVENDVDTFITFHRYCRTNKAVRLRALQDSAQYHWIVGVQDYYTREITFTIGNEFEFQDLPITLIVTRTPQADCFPNDNGIDTVIKTITPLSKCNCSIWGHYYGAWEETPLDSFEVAIFYDESALPDCDMRIAGLKPGLEDACNVDSPFFTNRYLTFDDTPTSCFDPIGVAELDSSLQQIKITYSISVTDTLNTPRTYHVFRGYRVN